jgi:hypothetical protein
MLVGKPAAFWRLLYATSPTHHRAPPPGAGVKVKPSVLRNLDPADRGRAMEPAGSEGIPLPCPTKGIALEPFLRWPGPTIRTTLVQSVLSLRACLNKIGGHHRVKAHD